MPIKKFLLFEFNINNEMSVKSRLVPIYEIVSERFWYQKKENK